MATLTYSFEGVDRSIETTDGDPDRPLVLLLHGTGGTVSDMVTPADAPDSNYDFVSPLDPNVSIGWRAYPGLGVWSCCDLDPKKTVRSWQDVFMLYEFRTAVYSQVDNTGFMARPVLELAAVFERLLAEYPQTPIVVLAHSRGGLLVRAFFKEFTKLAAPVCTVITLHSPHTGSALASIADTVRTVIEGLERVIGDVALTVLGWLLDIADSDAYREMAIGSSFLTDLAAGEAPLPGAEYYTFGGVSVRLSRIRSWVYTLDSSLPKWHLPPFEHERTEIEVLGVSPVAETLPNLVDELSDGRGDLLTADSRCRLPFATHQTNRINHAEALWDPILQAQVLRILGIDVDIGTTPGLESAFWS